MKTNSGEFFYNMSELGSFQNVFTKLHNIASLICLPDGSEINSANLLLIPNTPELQVEKIIRECFFNPLLFPEQNDKLEVKICDELGLLKALIKIKVNENPVANWIIGQVKCFEAKHEEVLKFAREKGFDEKLFLEIYNNIPLINEQRFDGIIDLLMQFIQLQSEIFQKNKLITDANNELQQISENLPHIIWKGNFNMEKKKLENIYISEFADKLLAVEKGTINHNIENFFKFIFPEYIKKINKTLFKGALNPGTFYSERYQVKKGNGEMAWFESTGKAYVINGTTQIFGITKDITEEKLAKTRLQENEIRFRELTEHLPSGVAVYWPVKNGEDFKLIDFNRSAEKISNISKHEVIGKTFLEIYPNMKNTPLLDALKKVNKTGQEIYLPPFYYSDPVRKGWRENFLYKLPNGEIVGIFRDVTALKNNEEELKEKNRKLEEAILVAQQNQMRFKALHDASFGGIAIHDKGIILDCNYGLSKQSGYSYQELIGSDGLKLIAEEWRELVMNDILREYEEPYEAFAIRKNGEKYPVRLEARMIPYEGKRVRVVEFRDISEQKRIEKDLILAKEMAEENERRFRTLAENVPGAIYLCKNDEKYSMLYLNDLIENITGFRKEDFLSQSVSLVDLFHPDYSEYVFRKVNESLEKEKPFHLEYKIKHRNGNWIWIEEFGSGVYEKNKLLFLEGILIDITSRKNQENDLLLAKEKAEQSDKLKSAFLANMSHEIRTPMNGILGFIDLLRTPGLSENEREEFSETINKSGERLLSTINDIIEFSKIEVGDIPLNLEEINLYDALMHHVNFFSPEANKKGISLKLEYAENAGIEIKTDVGKLDSILTNLIKNALKFTQKGYIILGCELTDGKLKFSISDTGCGIRKEDQELIFERFRQADLKIGRGHEGSGLGLAICQGYVEKLGGQIWVDSEPEKGSTFYFTINYEPVVKNGENPQIQFDSLINQTEQKVPEQTKKVILVAEDDKTSFMLVRLLLEKENYTVIRAENGIDAVNMYFDLEKIDLILMDLQMPEMDGLEATKQIRGMDPEIPIIAQTAYAFEGDREKSLEAGCNDYLSKPIKKEELLEKVSKFIMGHG